MESDRNIPYILNGELYQIQYQSGENVTVRCCNCPDRVYRGSVRSTGNFHMHIKRRHPDLLPRLLEMKVNALLDRRDKHSKNQRRTKSHIHRTATIMNGQTSADQAVHVITNVKAAQDCLEPPPLALMHTHKFKIKTAFQRHQMQKLEAAALQQMHASEEGMTKSNEPIDYSVKEAIEKEELSTKEDVSLLVKGVVTNNLSESYIGSDNQLATTYCFPKNNVQQSGGSHKTCHNMNDSYLNKTLKNENTIEQAIDLSPQRQALTSTSSLSRNTVSSTADLFDSSSTITDICRRMTTNICSVSSSPNGPNEIWSELLVRVEASLRGIQREMNARNQIEIAKFRYLHPEFVFRR